MDEPMVSPPAAAAPPTPKRSGIQSEYQSRLWSPSASPARPSTVGGAAAGAAAGASSIYPDGPFAVPPPPSPSRSIYSDRFIPSRAGSALHSALSPAMSSNRSASVDGEDDSKEAAATHAMLLRSEMLGSAALPDSSPVSGSPSQNVFRYKLDREVMVQDVIDSYSLSPLGKASEKLLTSPVKRQRKISKVPFKVLDAPMLVDDFYLDLVDWSANNVLAVGLGASVYLWNASNSKVTRLVELSGTTSISSISWSQKGTHLAVGCSNGEVQIFDAAKTTKLRSMRAHAESRIGCMSWNLHTLASGSRDRVIAIHDVRVPEEYTDKLLGHKQEVCGLRWSYDHKHLASGGNDNLLMVWNPSASKEPVWKFAEHHAAVKAIAWSPHQRGLLVSGGGTADRTIRFWNTNTGTAINCVDTGSQVCNLLWSKNVNELVSSHGYSLNQIFVWKYPSLTKLATLTGHTSRVLYLSISPDGKTIVSGAGDETLRFWDVFPGAKQTTSTEKSLTLTLSSSPTIR